MSTSINTIKKLLWWLFGVLVVTYIMSLNIENHFMELNSKWVSNIFLFTIAGGIFASLIVVILCEFVRYRQIKYATEISLITYLASLYGQFLIIRGMCKRAILNHDTVADNLIQSTCDNATMIADSIYRIDYTPFCSNNVNEILSHFKTEKCLEIKNVLTSFIFFKIAIHEDTKNLLKQGKSDVVTSDGTNVNKALNKIINQTSTILTYLDQIILQIDTELENKYNWQTRKQAINGYQKNYTTLSLDDYLNEDIIVF